MVREAGQNFVALHLGLLYVGREQNMFFYIYLHDMLGQNESKFCYIKFRYIIRWLSESKFCYIRFSYIIIIIILYYIAIILTDML